MRRSHHFRCCALTITWLALATGARGQAPDAGAQSAATADAALAAPDAGEALDAAQAPETAQAPDAGQTPAAGEASAAREQPPLAANAPEREAEQLQAQTNDTMIVTARRRKESLSSAPVAVTALNERQLESSAIRDLSDLNGAAPGFVANPGASQIAPAVLSTGIRGIGVLEIEKSYELPVGTMIDGIILGNGVGSNLPNFDLESVEILRGAQGTLFGRNVTAGLIALRTIRPDTKEYSGKAAFTYGAFNRQDYKLAVNVPVIKNVLAARAAVMWLNEDGYMNRIVNDVDTGKNSPNLNHLYVVGSLLFTPTKRWEVYLKYEHQRYRGQGLPSIVASNARLPSVCAQTPPSERDNPNYCRPRDESGRDIDFNDLSKQQKLSDRSNGNQDQTYDLNAITGEVTYRLSPKYSFVSLTGWRAFEDTAWTDLDATPVNSVNLYRHGPYKQISEELRFHAQPLDVLNLVAGVYGWYSYYRTFSEAHDLLNNPIYDSVPPVDFDDPDTPWDETVDGPNPPGSYTVADTQQSSYSAAVFAQGDWEFLPNTTLTLGGRLTHDIKDLTAVFYTQRPGVYMDTTYPPIVVTFPLDDSRMPFPAANPGEHALVDKHSWTRVTGKAGLSYSFDKDLIGAGNSLLLYGGYTSGYRSGGFNGRPATAQVAKPYNPETVDQFELGVKSSWWPSVSEKLSPPPSRVARRT